MPAFRFDALQPDGRPRQGTLEADNARQARSQLRAQGLVPIGVVLLTTPTQDDALSLPWWQRPLGGTRSALSSSQRALWTRQLADLLGSGLTVERALSALADESDHERQRHLLASIRAEVHAGSSLGRALSRFPREFPAVDCAVIAAGEQGGQLDRVLQQLAADLEAQQMLRSKLMGAALYPAIVTLVALAIVVFLLGSVVPQVAEVPLPVMTAQQMHDAVMANVGGQRVFIAVAAIAMTGRKLRSATTKAQQKVGRKKGITHERK